MRNDSMSNYINITVMYDEILAFSDFMYKMEELNLVPSIIGLARKAVSYTHLTLPTKRIV